MTDNYIAEIKCKNCRAKKWEPIEKGETIKDWMAGQKCDVCLCNYLEE